MVSRTNVSLGKLKSLIDRLRRVKDDGSFIYLLLKDISNEFFSPALRQFIDENIEKKTQRETLAALTAIGKKDEEVTGLK